MTKSRIRRRVLLAVATAALSAAAGAATWNDMVPHSNTINTGFWDTRAHAYVVNYQSEPAEISGLPLNGASSSGQDAIESFDGRLFTEDSSLFTEIVLRYGLLLMLK